VLQEVQEGKALQELPEEKLMRAPAR